MVKSSKEIKIYFVSIPAHKFLFIKNYESNGYWDFWERMDKIPGMDCDTICSLLDSMKGKLDGEDDVIDKYSGQIMARIFEKDGRNPQAYGIRLPLDFDGEIPSQMQLIDIPDGEYIVFEHGSFDYAQESATVGSKVQEAVASFDYSGTDYTLDNTTGRVSYFYHDPDKYLKRVLPVKKV